MVSIEIELEEIAPDEGQAAAVAVPEESKQDIEEPTVSALRSPCRNDL
jgi:hypothetical protein